MKEPPKSVVSIPAMKLCLCVSLRLIFVVLSGRSYLDLNLIRSSTS